VGDIEKNTYWAAAVVSLNRRCNNLKYLFWSYWDKKVSIRYTIRWNVKSYWNNKVQ